jgi:hypothetical protein
MDYEVFFSIRVSAGSPDRAADEAAAAMAGMSLSDLVTSGHVQAVAPLEVA